MYQCVKQFGSIKTGSFWDVDRYIVNSDGERRKVIIVNEDNWLLLSMTDFENHFAQANKPLTEQEYLQTCNTEQLAEFIAETINTNPCGYPLSCNECGLIDRCREDEHPSSKEAWVEWLKQPHTKE